MVNVSYSCICMYVMTCENYSNHKTPVTVSINIRIYYIMMLPVMVLYCVMSCKAHFCFIGALPRAMVYTLGFNMCDIYELCTETSLLLMYTYTALMNSNKKDIRYCYRKSITQLDNPIISCQMYNLRGLLMRTQHFSLT